MGFISDRDRVSLWDPEDSLDYNMLIIKLGYHGEINVKERMKEYINKDKKVRHGKFNCQKQAT